MSDKKRFNFQEIAERVDTLIDLAEDTSLIDNYRTIDVLKMVEKEFEEISTTLIDLSDIDLCKGN
ncbi:MAG: hypothetical protein KDC79_12445 [Cyclobacteriaceae bacterium]|nr:hypothetical protein [Cyclobacteriaceae bacterium]